MEKEEDFQNLQVSLDEVIKMRKNREKLRRSLHSNGPDLRLSIAPREQQEICVKYARHACDAQMKSAHRSKFQMDLSNARRPGEIRPSLKRKIMISKSEVLDDGPTFKSPIQWLDRHASNGSIDSSGSSIVRNMSGVLDPEIQATIREFQSRSQASKSSLVDKASECQMTHHHTSKTTSQRFLEYYY